MFSTVNYDNIKDDDNISKDILKMFSNSRATWNNVIDLETGPLFQKKISEFVGSNIFDEYRDKIEPVNQYVELSWSNVLHDTIVKIKPSRMQISDANYFFTNYKYTQFQIPLTPLAYEGNANTKDQHYNYTTQGVLKSNLLRVHNGRFTTYSFSEMFRILYVLEYYLYSGKLKITKKPEIFDRPPGEWFDYIDEFGNKPISDRAVETSEVVNVNHPNVFNRTNRVSILSKK